MNRCLPFRFFGARALACSLALWAASAGPALAQTGVTTRMVTDSNGNTVTIRSFPSTALRGSLQVQQPPEVLFEGQAARLSPGARIRGANNMLVLSGSIVGQTLPVMVMLDAQSMLHEVWVLNDAELALYPAKPSYSR
jgi:hypothetical protein